VIPEQLKPYYRHMDESSMEATGDARVVIPQKFRERILAELHSSHSVRGDVVSD